MKIVILGATGGIGLELVRQAVELNHEVTAVVRTPDRLREYADQIRIVRADLLKRDELAHAFVRHDAVLSAFGPRLPLVASDKDLLTRFAPVLTGAMRDAAVSRLVVVSVAFLFRDALLPPAYLFGRLFFPTVVDDSAAMESTIMSSGLNWTLVRPPQLTDAVFSGKYRVREGHLPHFGFKISRADVADYMIRTVADEGASSRKIIGLAK
jgi:putative NADH-flavin reductase